MGIRFSKHPDFIKDVRKQVKEFKKEDSQVSNPSETPHVQFVAIIKSTVQDFWNLAFILNGSYDSDTHEQFIASIRTRFERYKTEYTDLVSQHGTPSCTCEATHNHFCTRTQHYLDKWTQELSKIGFRK
jgi:hypothetical protein